MTTSPSVEAYRAYSDIVKYIDAKLSRINYDCSILSNLSKTKEHPEFLKLVEMGPRIIPYIIHVMAHHGAGWTHLMLLGELSKENPIKPEHAGLFYAQLADWLNWYLTSKYYALDDVYHGLVNCSNTGD